MKMLKVYVLLACFGAVSSVLTTAAADTPPPAKCKVNVILSSNWGTTYRPPYGDSVTVRVIDSKTGLVVSGTQPITKDNLLKPDGTGKYTDAQVAQLDMPCDSSQRIQVDVTFSSVPTTSSYSVTGNLNMHEISLCNINWSNTPNLIVDCSNIPNGPTQSGSMMCSYPVGYSLKCS